MCENYKQKVRQKLIAFQKTPTVGHKIDHKTTKGQDVRCRNKI